MLNAQFIENCRLGILQNFTGQISGAAIDSRLIQPGWAFFALKGEQADGHQFVKEALAKGAVLAVVNKQWAEQYGNGLPLLIVDDPALTLQELGRLWRRQFSIPVLGITGTNGKTTTRALITQVLQNTKQVHATRGNFNNQLGLPLTLLAMPASTQFCILEMGTNHFGEIATLCSLAEPTAGLITNVGEGHLEFFGDIEGVARAKAELFTALPSDGIAFVNYDDPLICQMPTPCPRFTFSMDKKDAGVVGEITAISPEGMVTLTINAEFSIHLPVPGQVFARNALAATAVGLYYGVPPQKIVAAIEKFTPVSQRMVVREINGWRIINDTYNANPSSIRAALQTLATIQTSGRRIFVMGDMLELGVRAALLHAQIGELVTQLPIDIFLGVGELTQAAIQAAQKSSTYVRHFSVKGALTEHLKALLRPGDVVLIKGSRGSRMEEIVKGITD